MTFNEYIKELNRLYKSGVSTEHTFRGIFADFLKDVINDENIIILNEPSRIEVGAPDFVLLRKDIPIGYIEAKDLGANLARF
ncbi:MAG: hypothetical protein GXO62_06685 [Epsilonproteobacteria bacterium]|nr:hypothetical protein [Campylobacterota bacterium]